MAEVTAQDLPAQQAGNDGECRNGKYGDEQRTDRGESARCFDHRLGNAHRERIDTGRHPAQHDVPETVQPHRLCRAVPPQRPDTFKQHPAAHIQEQQETYPVRYLFDESDKDIAERPARKQQSGLDHGESERDAGDRLP